MAHDQQVAEMAQRLVQMEQRQQELITEVQNQRQRSDSAEEGLLAARAQVDAHRISLQALQSQETQQGSANVSAQQQQQETIDNENVFVSSSDV